jgi:hypothetical protein
MKKLLILLLPISLISKAYSSEHHFFNIYPGDSSDIKKWTREDFIKEFFDSTDSAIALINLFFTKNKRAKTQTILGSALLIGGITALAIPGELGDDQKGFGDLIKPVAEPGAAALGAIFTTLSIIKLGKYTKQKLFALLSDHQKGIPFPMKYRKKLKWKYFKYRIPTNPKDL